MSRAVSMLLRAQTRRNLPCGGLPPAICADQGLPTALPMNGGNSPEARIVGVTLGLATGPLAVQLVLNASDELSSDKTRACQPPISGAASRDLSLSAPTGLGTLV